MKKILGLLPVLFLSACATQPGVPQPTTTLDTNKKTETVLAHHVQAIRDLNLDAVMSDFTKDSTLIFPEGVFHGLADIRTVFDARIKGSPPGYMTALKVVRQDVVGEVAYITFEAKPWMPLSSETYVLHDGKILVETFFTPESTP